MPPVVRIPDPTFERLQKIATPFTDTPASVIEKLLDHYDKQFGIHDTPKAQTTKPETAVLELNPDAPADLRHTKVLHSVVGDQPAEGWNDLVHVTHEVCRNYVNSTDKLRRYSASNIVSGDHNGSGFHYVSALGLSIQNVSANDAWQNAFHLAKQFSIKIAVTFEWRNKKGASHPGQRGTLNWSPD